MILLGLGGGRGGEVSGVSVRLAAVRWGSSDAWGFGLASLLLPFLFSVA